MKGGKKVNVLKGKGTEKERMLLPSKGRAKVKGFIGEGLKKRHLYDCSMTFEKILRNPFPFYVQPSLECKHFVHWHIPTCHLCYQNQA